MIIDLNFLFQIGSAKQKIRVQFESDALIVDYQQHGQNSCCFISLVSVFKSPSKFSAENKITAGTYDSLTNTIPDRIKFSNSIMSDQARKFCEQHLR